jgi:hypothetical protein
MNKNKRIINISYPKKGFTIGEADIIMLSHSIEINVLSVDAP